MTDTPLPPDVLDEKILGMTNAAGEPVDNERDATTIVVQQLRADGELVTTEIVTDRPPAARA